VDCGITRPAAFLYILEAKRLARRTIMTSEKPILRMKAKPVQRVDHSIRKLLDDMVDTMRDAPGVGLAGPQIGELLRVVVIEYDEILFKLVNPEITWSSRVIVDEEEGCLSIPGYRGLVPRHAAVKVRARDFKGKPTQIRAEDHLARIFQHEIDHLDGILFPDRMAPGERLRPIDEDDYGDEIQEVASGVRAR
jgi:peptide deformylase